VQVSNVHSGIDAEHLFELEHHADRTLGATAPVGHQLHSSPYLDTAQRGLEAASLSETLHQQFIAGRPIRGRTAAVVVRPAARISTRLGLGGNAPLTGLNTSRLVDVGLAAPVRT
jgi:hypothetical protein